MSAHIEVLSGLGDKGPAAIVVDTQGKRLLLDAGGTLGLTCLQCAPGDFN